MNATSVAATYVAQRTVDAPLSPQPYTPQPTFTRLSTYTPLPTQQPYTLIPTPKPNVVVVTPKPEIITATPSADQQKPPPGSTIQAGQSFTKGGITLTVRKQLDTANFWPSGTPLFGFRLYIENQSGNQIIILWKHAFVHAKDDKGKSYNFGSATESDSLEKGRQFTLADGETLEMQMYSGAFGAGDTSFNPFIGPINPSAKFLIFTLDQFAGMSNMNWRYDLP